MSVLEQKIAITVVARRCVYVNDHRIAGAKPYVSENLLQHSFTTTVGHCLEAFSMAALEAELNRRRELRARNIAAR